MANELLLDTGAFVALVNRSEKRHADCVAALDAWRGAIVTTDYALNKVARIQGIEVLNVNELANALKPAVLPGSLTQEGFDMPYNENGEWYSYTLNPDGSPVLPPGNGGVDGVITPAGTPATTDAPAADLFEVGNAAVQQYLNQAHSGIIPDDQYRSVSSVNQEYADKAKTEDNAFTKALKWFDSQKDQTKGAITTLAGSFIQGAFSSGNKRKELAIMKQNADANTAMSNIAQQKLTNASAISQTNFGAPNPAGLIYQNRRKIAPLTRTGA